MNNMNYMIQNKNFNDIIVIDNMNNNLKNQMNIQENFGLIPTFVERKDNLENYDGEYLSGGDVPYEENQNKGDYYLNNMNPDYVIMNPYLAPEQNN